MFFWVMGTIKQHSPIVPKCCLLARIVLRCPFVANRGQQRMKCRACDAMLNSFEATRKNRHNEFLDLCNGCYNSVKEDIQALERYDLMDMQDEVDTEE